MKEIRMTTAQAIVKFLDNQYVELDSKEEKFVKGFFIIPGHGNILGLGQALEENPGNLIVHQGRNEQGMAHAAIGYAKQKHRRQIYACTSSVGPGAANMITAAGTASANRIPVLFFPGDTYACRQPDPVLQQVEHFNNLTISTNDGFKAVCKFWDRITRPEQIMTSLISAMRILTDPADTGAVAISLPQDVEGEAYNYPADFFKKRVHRIERKVPTAPMLKDVVAAFKGKEKPMLICGGGVRYSEAAEAFKKFAEKFNIPFGETQAGKSAIPFDHPLNLGGIGTTGGFAANIIAKNADLVIGVGTRMGDFTTASKWLFQKTGVEIININIASFDTYKMDGIRVTADAKESLEALSIELEKVKYMSAYKGEIEEARTKWHKEINRLFNIKYSGENFKPEVAGHLDEVLEEFAADFNCNLTQTRAIGIIDEMIEPDAIVVGSSGSLPGDLQRVWLPKMVNTYHMEYGYSCMGYEVCGAFGVKLAEPSKEVYAFVGDGSYMMLHSELVTSIQEGAKINILLFDNAAFGCINNLQMENGQGSFMTEFRHRTKTGKLNGKIVAVDFAKNAAAYGCKTYTVKNEEELRAAITDAQKQKISTLIDIKVFPKTMTHGYEGFWRVGSSEAAAKSEIVEINTEMKKQLKKARPY